MMNGRALWFPGKTKKAVTVSYDDGNVFDRKLCEILKKYGVKGTFNINSAQGERGRRMSIEECIALYHACGQEVAYHGCEHLLYHSMTTPQVMMDVVNDRMALEALSGDFVIGGAYPYGSYNKDVKEILRLAGIQYSRTTHSTLGFDLPADWLEWHPTCHHGYKDLIPLVDRFVNEPAYTDARVFYLWGHSYEFHDNDNWNVIEEFCQHVTDAPVWHATNGEIYDYVNAYRALRFTADEKRVYNPTQIDVWFAPFRDQSDPVHVPAGKTILLPY